MDPLIVKVNLLHIYRASVINYSKESTTVTWKKSFIVISNPKIFLFQKITFLKLPILGSQEHQVSPLKDTLTKLLHYGIAPQMFC